jgi:hypothetical protein
MQEPAFRFVLYVSDPRTPADEQAVQACMAAPPILRQKLKLVVLREPGNTPLLEDVVNGIRTESPQETFPELQKLITSAVNKQQTSNGSEQERAQQAARRALLLGGPSVSGAGGPSPRGPAANPAAQMYSRPPAQAAAASAPPAAKEWSTFQPSNGSYATKHATQLRDTFVANPSKDAIRSEHPPSERELAQTSKQAAYQLDRMFGATPSSASGPIVAVSGSDGTGAVDADAAEQERKQYEEYLRTKHKGQAVIVPESDGKPSKSK